MQSRAMDLYYLTTHIDSVVNMSVGDGINRYVNLYETMCIIHFLKKVKVIQ